MQVILGADNGHRAELVHVRVIERHEGDIRVIGQFRAHLVRRDGDHTKERMMLATGTAAAYTEAYDLMIQSMITRLFGEAVQD